jgi:fructose-1,6-bisphosphatase/inositol monophosphatase family enzyme
VRKSADPAPPVLARAGLNEETRRGIEHLVVGCGGVVRELIAYTAGASTRKDDSGQRLSAADCLVDRLLREQLLLLVPGSSGYSEEAGAFGLEGTGLRVRWQLDPLDGTRPALLGGAFAVSVGALVLDGPEPVAAVGWVYVPTLSSLYYGVFTPDYRECRLNGRETQAECEPAAGELAQRYIAVGSDWGRVGLASCPLKLSAPGATAVHLAYLVHPGSDVAAVSLSRYRPYDAAAGLVVAAAGGCEVYPVDTPAGRSQEEPAALLDFLLAGDRSPDRYGPPALVSPPAVAACLRQS